jgi:hypothetical protein
VFIHTPVDATWLNQVEFHVWFIQAKVLTANDFASLEEVEKRMRQYEQLNNRESRPFDWRFDRDALRSFLERLEAEDEKLRTYSARRYSRRPPGYHSQPHSLLRNGSLSEAIGGCAATKSYGILWRTTSPCSAATQGSRCLNVSPHRPHCWPRESGEHRERRRVS